jgi:hypothetical protein
VRYSPPMSRSRSWVAGLVVLSFATSGCFHMLGRIPFSGEGEGQAVVSLDPGTVRFVTNIDVDYEGPALARYEVDLLQGDRVVDSASCNPLVRSGRQSCHDTVWGLHGARIHCSIVMACSAHLDVGGSTVVRARLAIPTKPASFSLVRADLLIGQ